MNAEEQIKKHKAMTDILHEIRCKNAEIEVNNYCIITWQDSFPSTTTRWENENVNTQKEISELLEQYNKLKSEL